MVSALASVEFTSALRSVGLRGLGRGVRDGRSYVSDGKSHLMDFNVNGVMVGVDGSEVRLSQPGSIQVSAKVAARLDEQPDETLRGRSYDQSYLGY